MRLRLSCVNRFALLTEEAQFTADQLCGAGAGCG